MPNSVQAATTRCVGTLPLPTRMRQCIDPASGIDADSDAYACRSVRQSLTRAVVAAPDSTRVAPVQPEPTSPLPAGAAWATRLANKNCSAAALTQERAAGAWPALPAVRPPKAVGLEQAVLAAVAGVEGMAPSSLLVMGWEHARQASAPREPPQGTRLDRGLAARGAAALGVAMGVAGAVTGLLPLLGAAVLLLLGAGVWALRTRPSPQAQPEPRPQPALPCAAQHLGSRHSMLRALGATLREQEVLQGHRWADPTLDRAGLCGLIRELARVKAQHPTQERTALHLGHRDAQAAAAKAYMADACLVPWLEVERGLAHGGAQQLSDAALLRLVWVFLSTHDALDACLRDVVPSALSAQRSGAAACVRLAEWQAALRLGTQQQGEATAAHTQAQAQLESFCTWAQHFLRVEYPRRLVMQGDALQEHWVSREQLRAASE